MQHKSYSEYLPPRLIESPFWYYLVGFLIVTLIVILIRCIFYLVLQDFSPWIFEYLLFLAIYISDVILPRFYRTWIHGNGDIEIIFNGIYIKRKFAIADIKMIHAIKKWTIYGYFIQLRLEFSNGKKIKVSVKDNEQFLAELKKYNPNIIIPELPVV